MKRFLLLGLTWLACLTSSPAAARLVSQEVHNGVRACLFEDLLGHREQLNVRAEDICPAYVHEQRQMAAPVEVPPFAILAGQEHATGGDFCVYVLNGVRYRRLIGASGLCTYTPN